MMELLHTRHEQESMHHDIKTALNAIRELPSVIARKGEGAAAMWGPDGGDLFEQVGGGGGGAGQGGRSWLRQQERERLCGLLCATTLSCPVQAGACLPCLQVVRSPGDLEGFTLQQQHIVRVRRDWLLQRRAALGLVTSPECARLGGGGSRM